MLLICDHDSVEVEVEVEIEIEVVDSSLDLLDSFKSQSVTRHSDLGWQTSESEVIKLPKTEHRESSTDLRSFA